MKECTRCDAGRDACWTLKNVKYSGGAISYLKSTMEVCSECRDEIRDSDSHEILG